MAVFVLVDDEACMGCGVALEQLFHAVLDCVYSVLVVFDNHDDL